MDFEGILLQQHSEAIHQLLEDLAVNSQRPQQSGISFPCCKNRHVLRKLGPVGSPMRRAKE